MKVAIFVEGLTETELVKKILNELCGNRGIDYEMKKQYRGRLVTVSYVPTPGATTHILIVNCQNDDQVKTQIIDQYSTLVAAGYTYIIGLMDVYPYQHADISKFEKALQIGLPTGPIPVDMHLSILETEAWFLDELTHFERVHPALTHKLLLSKGFDLQGTLGLTWTDPADTLDRIYQLARMRYKKKLKFILRTINALCPFELYINVRARAPSFDGFLRSLELSLF